MEKHRNICEFRLEKHGNAHEFRLEKHKILKEIRLYKYDHYAIVNDNNNLLFTYEQEKPEFQRCAV